MTCRFSVIVPSFDRPESLRECLLALAQQRYPKQLFEVIVVDDGSTVPLAASLDPVPEGLSLNVLRIANSGPGCARNVGAAAARGVYLAFTDDDCRPAPTWLQELEHRLDAAPERLIGGRTVNALVGNCWSTASQLIVDMVYAFYNATYESPRFFAANNMALAADLFGRAGGFRGGPFRIASEDREFCDRWLHGGNTLQFAANAIVAHAHHLHMASFFRQHFRYGRGAMRYHQLRRRRGSGRMREDLGFHWGLPGRLRVALRGRSRSERLALLPPLILWQIANLLGFLYEGIQPAGSNQEQLP